MAGNQDSAAPKILEEFHQHWWTVLIEGFLLLVLGTIAITVPFLAGIVITVVIGWLLIFAGLLGLWTGWFMRRVKGQGWAILSSVVAITAGAAFFAWPIGGLVSLTLVLGAYLTVDGVATIALALQHRRAKTQNWGWPLVNGILDLLLATAIIILQPGVNAWLVGVIVGVDLIFAGISMIAMGWSAKVHVVKLHA
jgi:uncharacterized membrane protein HdeD (DUF308 family)